MKGLLILLFSILTNSVFAQSLIVVDQTSKQKISDAFLINLNTKRTFLTNKDGMCPIRFSDKNDTIQVQHPSYNTFYIEKNKIIDNNYKIELIERIVDLPEFTVSSTGWRENASEVPRTIESISIKEIETGTQQTTADLLGNSGKVFIQKSQLGGGSPMIRGFAANRVLLVVDGVRMNNAIFRSGNLQNVISLDANNLDNVEVIYGPGSVIYGSDALGGVMSFSTLKPNRSYGDSININSNQYFRYASANYETSMNVNLNIGTKRWGFLSSFSLSDFEDLRSGSNFNPDFPDFGKRTEYVQTQGGKDIIVQNENPTKQVYSQYNQLNLLQKIRFVPSKYIELNYAFHYSTTSDIPRYDRLIEYKGDDLKFAEWYYGPQKWTMQQLRIDNRKSNFLFDASKIIIAYQNFEESRNDRKLFTQTLRKRTEKVQAISLNVDMKKELSENIILYYGFESIYNNLKSQGIAINPTNQNIVEIASRYPGDDNEYFQQALYANLKYKATDKIIIVSGIRASNIDLNSSYENSNFYNLPFDEIEQHTSSINGSIGLVFNPNSHWQINANLASGFRAPNIDDVAKVFDSAPGTVVVPNPNLKPEYVYSGELSVDRRFGKNGVIQLSSFYSYLTNAMVRRKHTLNGQDSIVYDGTLSQVEALVNTNKALIYGASASIGIDILNDFYLKSNVTYIEGNDITDNIPLRHIPPSYGKTSLLYRGRKLKLEAYSIYNSWKFKSDFAPIEASKTFIYTPKGSPSWVTLNIKSIINISKSISLNIALENIFDKHYWPYSSGIAAPGRNLIISFRSSF